MPFETPPQDQTILGQKSQRLPTDDSKKRELPTIAFADESGRVWRSKHPFLVGDDQRNVGEIWRSEDKVECVVGGRIENISFDEYLEMIGTNYGYYFKKNQQEDGASAKQREILVGLHKEAIDQRTLRSRKKAQQYTAEKPDGDNLQQETARAHSPFFIKIINDLGIDGLSAEPARDRNDYLDEIDEYLVLDPLALETAGAESGEKIYIGIQRSFREKELRSRVALLPEDPERGPIFKTFLLENLGEYVQNPGDPKSEESYWQKLLDLRAAKAKELGLQPDEYAQKAPKNGLSSVDKVLPDGVDQQIDKTLEVLRAVGRQLGNFIASEEFANLSPRSRRILEQNFKNMNMEQFVQAVEAEHSSH